MRSANTLCACATSRMSTCHVTFAEQQFFGLRNLPVREDSVPQSAPPILCGLDEDEDQIVFFQSVCRITELGLLARILALINDDAKLTQRRCAAIRIVSCHAIIFPHSVDNEASML